MATSSFSQSFNNIQRNMLDQLAQHNAVASGASISLTLGNLTNISQRQLKEREKDTMNREALADRILAAGKGNRRPMAEREILKLYAYIGLRKPKIVWYSSPQELLDNKDLVVKGRDYPADALAFRHLISRAFTNLRDSAFGEDIGPVERSVAHTARLLETGIAIPDGADQRFRDLAIASLRYGPSWTARRRRDDIQTEWNDLEPILEKLAVSTTGFILQSHTAHLVMPPTRVSLNDSRVLNNDEQMAVAWPDGKGIYALRGVFFDEDMWKKLVNRKLTTEEALGIVDVDQRRVAISYLKPELMIEALKAKLVDTGKNRHYYYAGRAITRAQDKGALKTAIKGGDLPNITINNKLYRTTWFFDRNQANLWDEWGSTSPSENDARYFLHYTDPSTGEDYISFCTQGVRERGRDADAVMAWKHHMTKDEYLNLYLEA